MIRDGSDSSLRSLLAGLGLDDYLGLDGPSRPCDCRHTFEGTELTVDATACAGDLATAAACRRRVIEALVDREIDSLAVIDAGFEYRYGDAAVELLGATGRFLELLGERDDRLAESAASDPLDLAQELETRVGPIADIAVESGFLAAASDIESYESVLDPTVGLTIGYYYVDRTIGSDARLLDVERLETGSEARIYDRAADLPLYSLDVVDLSLDAEQRSILLDGYEAIAEGWVDGDRAASRAIEYASDDAIDPKLTTILQKHTDGYGILEDLFADDRISDVYLTSPVEANPLRVEVDGESMETNVHLRHHGARALASRVRRTSGRAFSRAKPTIDATATLENGTGVRIAGITDPVSSGTAFAFRERADDQFTLPSLVANGTMSAGVAGFLSVAIERSGAALIAGTRGSGKTTLLGTLLYELTPDTRTVLIEDTPELPVDPLQSVGRDVQALRTGTDDGPEISPAEALRTALRLGDGALVVGEIRGEEARVLYEAMRVGANANAVMGTIHGDGAEDVYERVVSDLKVEPSSFAATDLVVTVQAYRTPDGRARRIARIEEVLGRGEDIWFEPLFSLDGETATPTGRIDRGESRFIEGITEPGEAYADVRALIDERADLLGALAADGRVRPSEVARAYVDRARSASAGTAGVAMDS